MDKLLIFFALLFLVACGNDTKPKEVTPEVTPTEKTTPTTAASTPTNPEEVAPLYPTLSLEIAKKLFEQTDYMDYVFYELPFSMNHGKKADIQNAIRYISTSPVTNSIPQCPSIGRVFYQAKGEIIGEAEFHFNDAQKCYYMVFLEEGKPKYANLLTTTGVTNYNNLFAQVKQ